MSKQFVRPADYIESLNINGLDGRLLHVPGHTKNSRGEILLVYDLDSNIEKWWGLVVALKRYGNVTMADLPGFGGMDSLFSIATKPTLNNLADYLAALVKLRYKRKRLSIIAIGFGFCVATRMLQRNPDVIGKVKLVVSINGYAHHDDFIEDKSHSSWRKVRYSLMSTRLLSFLANNTVNTPEALRIRYRSEVDKLAKQNGVGSDFIMQFKVDVARENDLRTKAFVMNELLALDNCTSRLSIPLWHITVGKSKTNQKLVEQHMKVIFSNYNYVPSTRVKNIPLVINDEKLAIKLLPAKLRRELKKATVKA